MFFGDGRAPWGSQFPLTGAAFKTSPTGHQFLKTSSFLQTFSTRKRGLTLPRDSPRAWSGCARGLVVLERGECGVLVCLTPRHVCWVAPSHHPPAGWLCLLAFLLLNYPSWKLIWSEQTHTAASFAVCSESFQISDQKGSREHFTGDNLTPRSCHPDSASAALTKTLNADPLRISEAK